MELRHLRYFVAVAEEGSVSVAAERRLHTTQPSLSRQLRDLEYEVGAQLMIRSARGVELTAAGRVFLDHARLALAQVDAAGEAVRRAAQPAKASFALGFLTGHEIDWLPEAIRLLRDELPSIEVTISSQSSPDLAGALVRSKLDAAFLRPEMQAPIWRSSSWPGNRLCSYYPAITASRRMRRSIHRTWWANIHQRVQYGASLARGHRRLPEAVRH
jgi:LysR family hca operon transcriptional activator